MNMTITVSDKIAHHLNGLSLGEVIDVNEKLRSLLEAEYRRRLARYRLIDRQLTQKYHMNFDTFEHQQFTKQHGYTWEIESDAITWETAIDGIRTLQKKLEEFMSKRQTHDS